MRGKSFDPADRHLDVGIKSPSRKAFDAAFPTLVRYVGIGIVVFFAVGSAFGLEIPESVLIAATGLILYKTVAANGSGNGGEKDGAPKG